MSVGTVFYPRESDLNAHLAWGEWSGYHSAAVYADFHDIEYNAIREAAALIDVSPLYKYLVSGPDAQRLVDRIVTRDATKLSVGGVIYTPWCDEHGKVIDDGTVHALDDGAFSREFRIASGNGRSHVGRDRPQRGDGRDGAETNLERAH